MFVKKTLEVPGKVALRKEMHRLQGQWFDVHVTVHR
jgi:hypothetical protein